ncbi:MAG: hypothetical protein LAT67_14510 [Balneolales bacterium]|nr:hypothetical protein [Balneolales bacterium]
MSKNRDNDKLGSEELIQLIKDDNQPELSRVAGKMKAKMVLYLRSALRVKRDVAEECVHNVFLRIFDGIRKGKINNVENIYGYCIISVKNEYFQYLRDSEKKPEIQELQPEETPQPVPVNKIEILFSRGRQIVLRKCVEALSKDRKSFFFRILQYLDYSDREAAELLNLGYGKFRTTKSRIINLLHDCVTTLESESDSSAN